MAGLKSKPRLYVHIFTGVGGGTGSGIFLDVCYLVQYALEGFNPCLLGYVLMPDVNLAKPGLADAYKTIIESNGYAALQELDYCMNFAHNGDSWHQEYPSIGLIATKRQPVDMCHLIASSTVDGFHFHDPYRHAMDVVAEYVMEFLVRPVPVAGQAAPFTLDSHLNNILALNAAIGQNNTDGAVHDYVALGAASAVVPYTSIATYVASKKMAGFQSLREKVSTQQDVDHVCKFVGLNYDSIRNKIMSGVAESFPVPNISANEAKNNVLVVEYFTSLRAGKFGQIATNFKMLSAPLPDYGPVPVGATTGVQSVLGLILHAVRDMIADPQFGPYAADQLVGGDGRPTNLKSVIADIKSQARMRLLQWRFNYDGQNDGHDAVSEENIAHDVFNNGGIFQSKRYKKWIAALQRTADLELRIEVEQQIIELMDVVDAELKRMSIEFTHPLTRVMDRLFATSDANLNFIATGKALNTVSESDELIQPLDTWYRQRLDKTAAGIDGNAVYKTVMGELLSTGLDAWVAGAGNDDKLASLLSDCLDRVLSPYVGGSFDDFLAKKYGVAVGAALASDIQNQLIPQLESQASPLLLRSNLNFAFDVMSSASMIVTVPCSSPLVTNAVKGVVGRGTQVMWAQSNDRISILKVVAGVPMWAYAGLRDYSRPHMYVGQHLYEGAERRSNMPQARDWSKLPAIIPLSLASHETREPQSDECTDASALFNAALKAGVIENTENGFILHKESSVVSFSVPSRDSALALARLAHTPKLQELVKEELNRRSNHESDCRPDHAPSGESGHDPDGDANHDPNSDSGHDSDHE